MSGAFFRSFREAKVSRSTRYHLLKKVGTSVRPVTKPRLTKVHIQIDKGEDEGWFLESSLDATLDGPDSWSKGWIVNERDRLQCLRRQRGGGGRGGITIWDGIIEGIIIGP